MKVHVNTPCGEELLIPYDDQMTVQELQELVAKEHGVPAELQQLRTWHTRCTLSPDLNLYNVQKTQFRGDEMILDLLIPIHGGGDAAFNCGDFHPAIKILCLQCSCVSHWKDNQLCCMTCSCSIQ